VNYNVGQNGNCRKKVKPGGPTITATVDKGISEKYLIPDHLWERMKGLLPVRERRYRNPGRKALEWRKVLNGIFYVLRTGFQW